MPNVWSCAVGNRDVRGTALGATGAVQWSPPEGLAGLPDVIQYDWAQAPCRPPLGGPPPLSRPCVFRTFQVMFLASVSLHSHENMQITPD